MLQHRTSSYDFLNSEDCFSDVEIKGGICFFLWNRNCPGKCVITTHSKKDLIIQKERYLQEDNSDVFIRYEEGVFIYNKVRLLAEPTFDTFVSSQRPFGLRTYVHGCKEYKPNQIMLYERGGTGYIDRNEITQNKPWIDLPKVFISAAYNAGDKYPHQILGKPIESHPGSACTETYVVIGPFDSQNTVKNVISYIRTKFFRFLVMLKKTSQHAASNVYSFVPIQDFSKPWTDEELYGKYKLTKDEIGFIEFMIKPMEA